jgi:predicted NBD/HSP70 family sugar kinase
MAYFAGLDVSVKETSVCIVDDAGKIVWEARVASEPEALLQVLTIKIQGSRGRVWADVRQVSIGRGRSERQNITLRR